MKVLENYFIFYFFYPLKSEILNQEKKIVVIQFFCFSSSDIRFQVKKSINQKLKKKLPNNNNSNNNNNNNNNNDKNKNKKQSNEKSCAIIDIAVPGDIRVSEKEL